MWTQIQAACADLTIISRPKEQTQNIKKKLEKSAKEIIQGLAKEVDKLKIENRNYERRIENLEELFQEFAEQMEILVNEY